MKRRRYWLIPVFALLLGLALAFFLFGGSGPSAVLNPTQLKITSPTDGSLTALHGTQLVLGDAYSSIGVRRMELWVNSQKWGEVGYNVPQKVAHESWPWTPSGEGQHVLLLRAVDAYGRTVEAATVTVFASAAFDVRYPLPYTADGSETLAGLAAAYGTPLDGLSASNPGFDPNAPIPPGTQLTIPVPVANSDPVLPQGGEPPVPPAGPLPGSGDTGQQGPIDLSAIPAFEISPSEIVLKVPVQQIYAYVSLGGQSWFRLPEGEFNFLPASGNTFDLKPYLTPEYLAGLPSPISFEAHVWGWAGGALVYLGHQSGLLDSSQLDGRAFTSSKLAIVGRIRDAVYYESEWNIPSPIPDYYHGFNQEFQWATTVPGVTGGLWQISTVPFGVSTPLLDSGMIPGPSTGIESVMDSLFESISLFGSDPASKVKPVGFTVDFSKYITLPPGEGGLAGLIQQIQTLTQPASGLKRFDPSWPQTFYVRVLPIMGNKLGEPSNLVVVHYGPPEPQPVTDATGPLFDVEVLSFTPYRASDPKYKACSVLTKDLKYCQKVYSLNPSALAQLNAHMQNVLKAAEQSGSLESYKYQYPNVIVETQKCQTTFPKGSLSCGCPGVNCSSSGSSCGFTNPVACAQEGVEWGVEKLKAASAWASEAYEDIKEFAVDVIMKYTPLGLQCKFVEEQAQSASGGELPPDLCRKAFKTAVEAGLVALGLPPSLPNFDEMMEQGEDYLVTMAVQELNDNGIYCDSVCEEAIRAGYKEIKNGVASGGSASGAGAGGPVYEPHPLAVDQPAIMQVRVTRRPETTGIPDQAASSCSLIVWNNAVNPIYGVKLEGALFSGLGMQIPLMQPGESVTIPVVLSRMPWYPPAGFSVKSASGQPIQSLLLDPVYGGWTLLYYGSTITFDIRSQAFETPGADGQKVSVKCIDNLKYQGQIPVP